MTSSKSSQTTRNVVIACLALWSVISLIVIVVWATSPDLKSAAQCRADLHALTEKMEGAKVVWAKDRAALEALVNAGWENQTRQRQENELLLGLLMWSNASLAKCRDEKAVLHGNISALETTVELQKRVEANLTSEILLQQDHIDVLQQNLTESFHRWESCVALRAAAESQRLAANSQMKACDSSKQYLQKQFQRCKSGEKTTDPGDGASAGPPANILVVVTLACLSVHLMS